MRDAESRFADSTHCAGAGRNLMSGVSSRRAASTGGDGSGAPSGRLLPGVLVALLGLLILAFSASSASAALRHSVFTSEFGPDGTNATSSAEWPEHRLRARRTSASSSAIGPERPTVITVNSPGSYTPLPGSPFHARWRAVGNSGGWRTSTTAAAPPHGNIYTATDSKQLRRLDSGGRIASRNFPIRSAARSAASRSTTPATSGRGTRPPNRWRVSTRGTATRSNRSAPTASATSAS